MSIEKISQSLTFLGDQQLQRRLLELGQLATFSAGKIIMEPGQFIKSVPLILEGTIKILRTDAEGNELFLYYLEEGETCALSLTCCTASKPSEIRAIAENEVTLLFIPIQIHEQLMDEFKRWKEFVSSTYQHRFQDLLTALDAVAFKRMDERLMRYLVTKMKQLKSNELHTTHQEVAKELGTSREVVSRLLKQVEKKKWIELGRNVIYIRDDFEELISK
ncbi:MAG: Crp/Fnr family transcriptional regulator [Bacteroidota bacterium]|jgi:CRP/FNR family transcriptional regulator|nr:Crp/Fnr family transcriptional regulator [Algoriphagus sp.]